MTKIIFLLTLFVSYLSIADAQIVDFSASATEGCGVLDVTFNNISSPQGSTFFWDFGNGQTSTLENPSIIYTNPGVYNVSLTVDGTTGIKNNFITIHPKPVPDFSSSPELIACAPLNVSFTGTAGASTITSWYWDFGDGNTSSLQNPVHSYNSQNAFTVSLVVVDNNNCQGSVFKTDYVKVYKPVANFSADNQYACQGNLNVSFTSNSSFLGATPAYFWEFGDGTTSAIENPLHTYTENGHYGVKLTVTDENNCVNTKEVKDFVVLEDVSANFSVIQDTVCIGNSIQFTNLSLNANSFAWDFGDSTNSTTIHPKHVYTEPGNYLVKLKVNNSGTCSDEFSKNVHVQKVEANFTLSSYFECELPAMIKYNNHSLNGDYYNWRFGNKIISNEFEPTIEYAAAGLYVDTLVVTSKYGCKDIYISDSSLSILVPYANCSPNIFIRPNEHWGCIPLTVNFKDESQYFTNRDYIKEWSWNFGDGKTSNMKNPTNTYNAVGTYPVSFEITTNHGCKAYASTQIRTGTVQKANFSKSSSDAVCASQKVQFTDLSKDQDLINSWYWDFGDGKNSTAQNPEHLFADTGSLDISLIAYYNGCPAKTTKRDYIYVKGPYLEFNYDVDCNVHLKSLFTSKYLGGTSFSWDFGDGGPANTTQLNPTHQYNTRGEYIVSFNAANSANACTYAIDKRVIMTDIKADYTTNNTIGCVNLNANFNSGLSVDVFPFVYKTSNQKFLWDFGDNTPFVHTNEPIINHKFNKKGVFNVKLVVSDMHGCKDSLEKIFKIFSPSVAFEASQFTGCRPLTVTFENNVLSDTIINDWLWNFGDGTSSTEINPIHVYNDFGNYTVSLQAKDVLGCTSLLEKVNYIKAFRPSPDFSCTDQTTCTGTEVSFAALTDHTITSYLWDFGDGTTSTLAKPSHNYSNSGKYNISLSLVDDKGCDSSTIVYDFMDIQSPPVADFIGDDLFTNCFPLIVNFSDRTNHPNLSSWHWEFGDGAYANVKNPLHIYNKPGDFTISLNAKTSYGCPGFAEKVNYIHVGGPFAEIIAEDTICKNVETTLIAKDKINVDQTKWFFDNGVVIEGDTASHVYNKNGMVYPVLLLTVDDAQTCDKYFTDSIYINKLIAQINTADENFTGCEPFQLAFVSNSFNATGWNWDFGDGQSANSKTPFHVFTNAGDFITRLIVSDELDCLDTAFANIKVHPRPVVTAKPDTLICLNDSVRLNASGASYYEWYPNYGLNNNLSQNPVASPNSTIDYVITGTDTNNCINYAYLTLKVQQKPIVNIADTSVIIGENVILNASSPDILTYKWNGDYNFDCDDCPSIVVKPIEPTHFYLTFTDTSSCFILEKDIFIDIVKAYTVDVPQAFTPNGDGINDIIFVKGWGIKELIEFKIFNRFGEKVFESNDITLGWDGKNAGIVQNTETFTYIIRVKNYDDAILSKTGTIKLLK